MAAPEPSTPLGYRRLLSPTAGVRVSPLCLGGMSLGKSWAGEEVFREPTRIRPNADLPSLLLACLTARTGEITKDEAFALLDAFYDAGGNFIDVANLYHEGESEEWVGEWMEARGVRDKIVLATKYSGFGPGSDKDPNNSGNHAKSLHLGIRDSLKRLKTDYIDVYYVHFW